MGAPETMAPRGHDREDARIGGRPAVRNGTPAGSAEPVSTLRGAGVQVDVRRAGSVALGLAMVALAVVAGVLMVAGFEKNSQIDRLRAHGVPVELTVTHCLGLMGGSGSNLAGYDCSGTYTVDGHVYTEDVPGNTLHAPGTTVRGVTVPGDPALFSTPDTVASEHSSWSVYLVPVLLLLALLLGLVATLVIRRHGRERS